MCCSAHGVPMQQARNETRTERDGKMAFLKKHLKRAISMWLALLFSVPALPATAFAAQDNASTLAEVTAKQSPNRKRTVSRMRNGIRRR